MIEVNFEYIQIYEFTKNIYLVKERLTRFKIVDVSDACLLSLHLSEVQYLFVRV